MSAIQLGRFANNRKVNVINVLRIHEHARDIGDCDGLKVLDNLVDSLFSSIPFFGFASLRLN